MPRPAASAPGAHVPADASAELGMGAQRIQAVDRAVALLKFVASATTAPTVLELARHSGLNRSTAWRRLRTLEHHGLVDRDPITQRYTVGYGTLWIAAAATDDALIRRVRPLLEELADKTGESVTLAVAKRFNLVYVDQVDPPNVMAPNWLDKPLPLHATSGGKVFLAWLRPDERDAILPREAPAATGQPPARLLLRAALWIALPSCRDSQPSMATVPGSGHRARCLRIAEAKALAPAVAVPRQQPGDDRAAPVLEIRGVSASYGRLPVLRDISLSVRARQCLAVVGTSRSGKTTLARCIVGLHKGWAGDIWFAGAALAPAVRRRSDDQLRRIQYISQNPYSSLNPRRTIGQIVEQPLAHLTKLPPRERREAVMEALDAAALDLSFMGRYPDELSGRNGRGSPWPAPSSSSRNSSSVTRSLPRWMCRSRPRSSNCCSDSRPTARCRCCSSLTTCRSSAASRTTSP